MIEKMQFVSITGPQSDIDRMTGKYLSRYEIHLENALSQLKTAADLRPFNTVNPYKESFHRAEELMQYLSHQTSQPKEMSPEQAIDTVQTAYQSLASLKEQTDTLTAHKAELLRTRDTITPFINLDFDLEKILKFQHIKYRFGRISKDYEATFTNFIYDTVNTLFYRCYSDNEYIYGVSFAPADQVYKVDVAYKSIHFERIRIPDGYSGTPAEIVMQIDHELEDISKQQENLNAKKEVMLSDYAENIVSAYEVLSHLAQNFDIRKMAACTPSKNGSESYYILCGWMTDHDCKKFIKETEQDDNIYCIIENQESIASAKSPTKLKNPKILKPFEMYTRMYGLPAYDEFDPTLFLALTYTFIFGWMFGDVGHGLLLCIGGFTLYKLKKMDLAGIIGYAGIFSMFFGFMFGSVFGFEDVIPALWLKPGEAMTTLPFIGSLNTVFVVAIAFGMAMIIITMILHIIVCFKNRDLENAYFDTNGIAGLVFYAAVVLTVVLYMTGHTLPATMILVIFFVVPLILVGFKEQVAALVLKKKAEESNGPVMIVVQAIFELIEVLLSYFSNTISFIRIGAFAVSHGAMMEVVMMLAGAENGGSLNWIVVILGNLFVCGFEGLIVGIQVLRLEYYEFFSRFYKGSGREFHPYKMAK
ncbi:MAG: V-type ATP synthase subunit I [Lachnospiraceae bacterium]